MTTTQTGAALRVLVACEFSGVVRRAFRDAGHDAWSCDLLPAEDNSEFHIQGDVLEHLTDGWDIMIAHPPCTYLANSGVRWLHEDIKRWPKLFEAAAFFNKLLNAPIPLVIIENPIMHKYAAALIGQEASQVVQPWMFGDNETKAVCLWVHQSNDILLTPWVRKKPDDLIARVWRMAPGPERQKERSRFFPGIAKAMAEQYGASHDR